MRVEVVAKNLNPHFPPDEPYYPPWGFILTVLLIPIYVLLWPAYWVRKPLHDRFWENVWDCWSGYRLAGVTYKSGLPELPRGEMGVLIMECADGLRVFSETHVALIKWSEVGHAGQGFREVTYMDANDFWQTDAVGDELQIRFRVGGKGRTLQFGMLEERVHEWRDIIIAHTS